MQNQLCCTPKPKEDDVDADKKVTELVSRCRLLGKNLWDVNLPGASEAYLRAVQQGQILPSQGMLEKLELAVAELEKGGTIH